MVPTVINTEQRELKEMHQLLKSFPGGDTHHVHSWSLARINHLVPTESARAGVLGNAGEHTGYWGSASSAAALPEKLLSQLSFYSNLQASLMTTVSHIRL